MKKNRIFLIRHGQASWGKRNYDVLSPQGIQQANVLGTYIKSWPKHSVLATSGTLKRHRDTATNCLQSMGFHPQCEENPAWTEFDFKNIIGCYKPIYRMHSVMVADLMFRTKPKQRFKLIFDQAIKNWVDGIENKHYTETWIEFKQRVLNALNELKNHKGDEDIFIFTSGGVISAIVCDMLGLDDSQWPTMTERFANTSITQLLLENKQLSLISINEHAHLRGQHQHLLSFH